MNSPAVCLLLLLEQRPLLEYIYFFGHSSTEDYQALPTSTNSHTSLLCFHGSASLHTAAWSVCLSPPQIESQSLPRCTSPHQRIGQSKSLPWSLSLTRYLTRCLSIIVGVLVDFEGMEGMLGLCLVSGNYFDNLEEDVSLFLPSPLVPSSSKIPLFPLFPSSSKSPSSYPASLSHLLFQNQPVCHPYLRCLLSSPLPPWAFRHTASTR